MNVLMQVALGGALGAVLRFGIVQGAGRMFGAGAPVGVAAINIAGSFVMGLAAVWFMHRVGDGRLAPFVMAGVLGGFTTFSAFSLDAVVLWEQGRQVAAGVYVLGSVFGAIAALVAGMIVMRAALA